MTHKDELHLLIQRSEEFLATAKYQINQEYYGLSIFSLEQALELFLKAQVLARGVDYPRSPSVRSLLEILLEISPSEEKKFFQEVFDKFLLELGLLEDAYITARYILRTFTQKEAAILIKVVEEIIKACPIKS